MTKIIALTPCEDYPVTITEEEELALSAERPAFVHSSTSRLTDRLIASVSFEQEVETLRMTIKALKGATLTDDAAEVLLMEVKSIVDLFKEAKI